LKGNEPLHPQKEDRGSGTEGLLDENGLKGTKPKKISRGVDPRAIREGNMM